MAAIPRRVYLPLTSRGYGPPVYLRTGIDDIAAFVNVCPDKDKAHTRIRRGFATLRDGLPVGEIPCSGTFATMPIKALTAELIALQTIRIAYYVNPGPIGYLPWTSKNLHD
ncbi:MAG: hypothetical protein BWY10_00868 [Chloroflexi bacterium ADurb.Bin180]|nr:MAG: hypothetical protein BWY10_00868 [Chloroflexi bacterium ADurb.Bin180]